MFEIEYTREASKALLSLPRNLRESIRGKIELLAMDPFAAPNVKKLLGRNGYRLRVADWRVIYEVHGDRLVIQILTIAPRGGAYK